MIKNRIVIYIVSEMFIFIESVDQYKNGCKNEIIQAENKPKIGKWAQTNDLQKHLRNGVVFCCKRKTEQTYTQLVYETAACIARKKVCEREKRCE